MVEVLGDIPRAHWPGNGEVGESEVRELAALHVRCLPTSLPALLGESYTRHLYRYIARSPHEGLALCSPDGAIVGAAIVTFAIASLPSRLLWHTPLLLFVPNPRLLGRLVKALLLWLTHRLSLNGRMDTEIKHGRTADLGPELVWFFVTAAQRGTGVGSALLVELEANLVVKGQTRYCAFTIEDESESAVQFYLRHGFARVGYLMKRGTSYLVLQKQIAGKHSKVATT